MYIYTQMYKEEMKVHSRTDERSPRQREHIRDISRSVIVRGMIGASVAPRLEVEGEG